MYSGRTLSCCHRKELLPFHIPRLTLQMREHLVYLYYICRKPRASLRLVCVFMVQSLGDGELPFGVVAYCPLSREDRLGHWTTLTQLFCSVPSTGILGMLHVHFSTWCRRVPGSSLALWERFLLTESFCLSRQQSFCRVSLLQTFFPGTCSFHTLTLTLLKNMPKSLDSVG